MKKIKIEDSPSISRPFKVLLGFILACVALYLFLFAMSEAKRSLFTLKPWEPTGTATAKVIDAHLNIYTRAPSDYTIRYTYTVNGRTYNDYDSVGSRDYMHQQTLDVMYKKADPSVNRLALSDDNSLTFIGAVIISVDILVGAGFLSAYYFMGWRPKNPRRLRQIAGTVLGVGILIMLMATLL